MAEHFWNRNLNSCKFSLEDQFKFNQFLLRGTETAKWLKPSRGLRLTALVQAKVCINRLKEVEFLLPSRYT